MKKIHTFILITLVVTMFSCSKNDQTYLGPNPPPQPPPQLPTNSVGFWMEDPLWSGDAYTYYPDGYINVSIDNGPVSTIYYVLGPSGPLDCSSTGVLRLPVSFGSHTYQVYNKANGMLLKTGVFGVFSSCQVIRVF